MRTSPGRDGDRPFGSHRIETAARTGHRPVRDLASPDVRVLHAGPVVTLADWYCPGHDASVAQEECGDAYEIVVARRGMFAREMGGQRVVSDAGTATFWHPGESYRVTHPVPGGDCCSIVRLPVDGVRALLATVDVAQGETEVPRFPSSFVALTGRPYLLHRLAMAAARTVANGGAGASAARLRAEESAVAFAAATVAAAAGEKATRGSTGPPSSAPRNRRAAEFTARVREYLAGRYRQPLRLHDIATAIGCSPFHLSRTVSASAGLPIFSMIIRLRLRYALEQLLETKDDISAIAFEAGFASHSHFSEAFRREFGLPPVMVRRSSRGALSQASARPQLGL